MNSISVQELQPLLDQVASEVVLIDVRNPAEADVAVIPGCHLIPLATIESGEAVERIRELASGRQLFVHCKLGGRSAKAVQLLLERGIPATNVEGGIDAWAEYIDPSMPRY